MKCRLVDVVLRRAPHASHRDYVCETLASRVRQAPSIELALEIIMNAHATTAAGNDAKRRRGCHDQAAGSYVLPNQQSHLLFPSGRARHGNALVARRVREAPTLENALDILLEASRSEKLRRRIVSSQSRDSPQRSGVDDRMSAADRGASVTERRALSCSASPS